MDLQQFKFTIQHRPGKANANADALSRIYDRDVNIPECYMINIETYYEEDSIDEWKHSPVTLQKRQESLVCNYCNQPVCRCHNFGNDDDQHFNYNAWFSDNTSECDETEETKIIIQPIPCNTCEEITCIGCLEENFTKEDSDAPSDYSDY